MISSVIELEIPFSKNGILGQSYNNFVIFDTPGSNSQSNKEHSEVLVEALDGFSNGIPVWVSTYESMDSTDNASLCEKILQIEALDKRFTMIVLNKADGSDLDEHGFSEKREQEILEYDVLEKMYASGIYFVSSVMGLGAKNSGTFIDKHYRKIYRSQEKMYSDSNDEDYIELYTYNIMPCQMKKNVKKYSEDCQNRIYANSGLYCVEQEMENFASKYAAYNKCQMVLTFLDKVVDKTDRRIASRTESLKRIREARFSELERAKTALIMNLKKMEEISTYEFWKDSKAFVKSFISKNLTFRYEVKKIEMNRDKFNKEIASQLHLYLYENAYEDAKKAFRESTKNGVVDIFKDKGKFFHKVSSIKDDWEHDYTILMECENQMLELKRKIDKETSDKVLESVTEDYKEDIIRAQEFLGNAIKQYWQDKAQSLKNKLIKIVTGADNFPIEQKEEITSIIMKHPEILPSEDIVNPFTREKFIRRYIRGLHIVNDEKLNLQKLTRFYNDKISEAIEEMANELNDSSYCCFGEWKENLCHVIETNITEYNPQLRDISDMIKEESEKIEELENCQSIIKKSLIDIKELIQWKDLTIGGTYGD